MKFKLTNNQKIHLDMFASASYITDQSALPSRAVRKSIITSLLRILH